MNIKRITAVALLALTGVLSAAPLKIGWAINDISTDKPVELAGMGGGYLATERATENGGYGTGFLCPVSPQGGQEIVEAAVATLNELKAEDARNGQPPKKEE